MADLLTRKGARNLTRMMDRVASAIQTHPEALGIPPEIALDYAKRSDLLSDTIEMKAADNYPLTAAEVDTAPAAKHDPEVPNPSAESAGGTDESPKSSDQNKPEAYYEHGKSKVAEDALLRKLLAEEGMLSKNAAPEFAQPARNETGDSVEPAPFGAGSPHWDANAIGDDRGGPYKHDADEAWMQGEFSQERFHTLRDKQQAGVLPQVDAKLASLDVSDLESLRVLGASIREFVADANLSKMPGFSPSQLRGEIDRIVRVRQEAEKLAAQYEAVLKQLKALEKEEKDGLATLKKAAAQMREKGKYLAETETALLQFTAYLTEKRPGIEQMIARGEEYKGQKAGDFFGRIAAQLGDEVAEKIEMIYEATKEDLTHTTMAVRGLKVVVKTASVDNHTLRQAGLADMVVSLKEWIAGQADSVAQKILGFAGDIRKWFRGFVERTKMVRKQSEDIRGLLGDTMKAVDGALAQAGRIASDESHEEASEEDDGKTANFGFNLFQ